MITFARHSQLVGLGLLGSALCSGAAWGQQPLPTQEEMWRIIQEQARQLEEQKRELEALKQAQKEPVIQENRASGRAPAEAAANAQAEAPAPAAAAPPSAAAPPARVQSAQAPGTVPILPQGPALVPTLPQQRQEGGWWERTSIGAYGELHYEGGSRDQIDFHRFVLFVGHQFNDRIRLFSEIEFEHTWVAQGRPGELQLEQGFLQFDLTPNHRVNAGIVLVPVGFLNERHEPPTFYGVERNAVETNIIPTTWWEGGVGLNGSFGDTGLDYDFQIGSGLNVPLTGANAFRVRNGRQKVANAIAREPSLSGRLHYTGLLGIELAATAHYQFDITQGAGDPITKEKVPAWLLGANAAGSFLGFGFRALYASWWIDSEAARLIGRDRQTGYFLEPSYRFAFSDLGLSDGLGELGVFYRYSWWDNNAGESSLGLATKQHSVGVNYWPVPEVVLKLDYLWERMDTGAKADRLNAGIGFWF